MDGGNFGLPSNGAPMAQPSMASHAIAAAPYERQRPSPPFIAVPHSEHTVDGGRLKLVPSYENADPSQLTTEDLEVVTQNKVQTAQDRTLGWTYEQRRQAQLVLDFLYLGPTSIVRDHEFLRREGITMVVIARHASMASQRMLSVERVTNEMGIAVHYIDVEGDHQLVSGFPKAIRVINNHLLSVYRAQAQGRDDASGQMLVEPSNFRRGKVLVACDSGNDRSAALVAAYIMSVFGKDMWAAISFISVQRFCCTFTEELKRVLLTWEDMLKARSAVYRARQAQFELLKKQRESQNLSNGGENAMDQAPQAMATSSTLPDGKAKRGLDDMMDMDEDPSQEAGESDRDRFLGRDTFAPFVDRS